LNASFRLLYKKQTPQRFPFFVSSHLKKQKTPFLHQKPRLIPLF
jgi:hypothetical protein